MLQRVDQSTLRQAARRDLASSWEGVAADVAEVLARWPAAPPGARFSPIARFSSAGAGGGLVQVSGRAPGRSRLGAAGGPVEGRRVYAIGDVHGCYDLLIALLQRLGDDAAAAGPRATTLILLGDYVDRGPDSARVVEALCLLKSQAPFEVCLLKGNHEDALLRFLDAPSDGGPWLAFGGAATLALYGVDPPDPEDGLAAYATARDELLRRMPAAHLRLLQTLDLMAVVGDFAFVHAGVAPGEPLRGQSERDLLWIRREFLEARGPFEKVIVHGHTWDGDRPAVTPARIGLDTGAYETGVLSAMRFEDEERVWLAVRDGRGGRPPLDEVRSWVPAKPLDFTAAGAGFRVLSLA